MTTNPPAQNPEPQVQPIENPAPQAALAGNKFSAANDLMFEDCLKSIILKAKTGKTYSSYKTPFCPKAKHSPFGDFPPEYMPQKTPQTSVSMKTSTTSMFSKTSTMRST